MIEQPRTTRAGDGPLLFARYAYPPNALGYCGPNDTRALLGYAAARTSDEGLRRLALEFDGAWPYLQLIAAANEIPDPLDARVVHAYWVDNRLLDRVDPSTFAAFLDERFARRAGRRAPILVAPIFAGAVPHHNFHVFGVYPWVGLLRAGLDGEPLRVIESCRIRWGTVVATAEGTARVRSQPITWDGRRLDLGMPRIETVQTSIDGLGLASPVAEGDRVAMHWGWVCDRLAEGDVIALQRLTIRTLAAVNAGLRSETPATGYLSARG